MWVIVMFDLPVDTKLARKQYTQFRKGLIRDGFAQMQYSVYTRNASSRENAAVHVSRVQGLIPSDGEIRILTITDKQMERMDVFWGKIRKPPDSAPTQLSLF